MTECNCRSHFVSERVLRTHNCRSWRCECQVFVSKVFDLLNDITLADFSSTIDSCHDLIQTKTCPKSVQSFITIEERYKYNS